MYTLADVGAGWFFLTLALGTVAAAGLFLSIALVEALVLRGLKWGSFRLSFVDSVVINLTSATIGVVLFAFSAQALNLGAAPLLLLFGALTGTHRRWDAHPFEAASLAYNVDRGDRHQCCELCASFRVSGRCYEIVTPRDIEPNNNVINVTKAKAAEDSASTLRRPFRAQRFKEIL